MNEEEQKIMVTIKVPNPFELLGWYGVIAIVLGYLLINLSVVTVLNPYYQFLNLTGAIGIIISSSKKKDYQPLVINLIWALIGIIAIARIVFKF